MRLSALQKYILLQCYNRMGFRLDRAGLLKFYGDKRKPRRALQAKIITRSMERLIDDGFLIGYGVRTPRKWFVKEIRLTGDGVRVAKKLLGEQLHLPLKK